MEEESLSLAGVTSSNDDITNALHQMQLDKADAIGVPKVALVLFVYKTNEVQKLFKNC